MERKVSAGWCEDLKSGQGLLSTKEKCVSFRTPLFAMRFENGIGTNPEELPAAARAGYFAMELSPKLGMANLTARRLEVTATVTLQRGPEYHAVTKSHLDLWAQVLRATRQASEAAFTAAEIGCPVSKLFRAPISVEAHLDAVFLGDVRKTERKRVAGPGSENRR